jgi:amidase
MGNDYGGSLRWPSQCCGTTALRPTLGRVPFASSIQPEDFPITLQLYAVQGPMARRVGDLRLALALMSGPDARDPWWTPAPLESPRPDGPLRVAVTVDPAGQGVDPSVAAGVRAAAKALAEAGYEVDEVDPPAIAEAADTWAQQVLAEVKTGFLPLLEQVAGGDALRFLDQAFAVVPELDYEQYVLSFGARSAVARSWSQFFQDYQLVLGPVATIQPFPAGFDLAGADEVLGLIRAMRLVVTVNLLGLPAVAVPVGVEQGIPQGVQVIGNRYREDLCLDAAEAIETRLGTFTPIDPR